MSMAATTVAVDVREILNYRLWICLTSSVEVFEAHLDSLRVLLMDVNNCLTSLLEER